MLGERISVAGTTLGRVVGLLGRRCLEAGTDLLILPSHAIHTVTTRFAIDAVFLDREWRVVRLRHAMAPFRMTGLYWKAQCVLELPAGVIAETSTAVGNQPVIREVAGRTDLVQQKPPTAYRSAKGCRLPANTRNLRHSSDGMAQCHEINDSGQTLVEFALALMILLALVFGTMDFANLFYHKLTLQNAVRQAGRYAITGQCILGKNGSCSMSRYLSIRQVLQTASAGILNPSNIASDATIVCTNQGGGCPTGAGGPGDLVTITVTYQYHFMTAPIAKLFSNGIYKTVVSSAFINEPFPPTQS